MLDDTVAGAVTIELLVWMVTDDDPPAGLSRPIVQLAVCPALSVAGEQLSVPT